MNLSRRGQPAKITPRAHQRLRSEFNNKKEIWQKLPLWESSKVNMKKTQHKSSSPIYFFLWTDETKAGRFASPSGVKLKHNFLKRTVKQ